MSDLISLLLFCATVLGCAALVLLRPPIFEIVWFPAKEGLMVFWDYGSGIKRQARVLAVHRDNRQLLIELPDVGRQGRGSIEFPGSQEKLHGWRQDV